MMTLGIWIFGVFIIMCLSGIYDKLKENNELLKELNKNLKGLPGWKDPDTNDNQIDMTHLSGHLPK